MTASAPLTKFEQVSIRIQELEKALQINAPGYASLLHTLHVNLQQDEELTHLLTEEQIGIIVQGLAKRTQVVIAENTAKGKSVGGKSLKNLELGSDL